MGDGPPTDAEVIRRCRSGDVEWFSVLVERYQDRVYNLAFRLLGHPEEARDAAQEAFVRAFAALPQFDLNRPVAPWLLRIAANGCYGLLRKRRSDLVSLDAMEEAEADAALSDSGDEDPARRVEQSFQDAEIQQAVLALPEPYRSVVLLRYMEEMSYDQIAESLEIPLGTVKTLLHRARLRLRRTLSEVTD
jgi:RNA polymerase sigma-70 factor (ECF subfamily)